MLHVDNAAAVTTKKREFAAHLSNATVNNHHGPIGARGKKAKVANWSESDSAMESLVAFLPNKFAHQANIPILELTSFVKKSARRFLVTVKLELMLSGKMSGSRSPVRFSINPFLDLTKFFNSFFTHFNG